MADEQQQRAASSGDVAFAEQARQEKLAAESFEVAARRKYEECVATMRSELAGYDARQEEALRRWDLKQRIPTAT